MADLQELGQAHWNILEKGSLNREIDRAMWSIDNPGASWKGPKEAMDIAEVMHKWSELTKKDQNSAGAWIAKLPGTLCARVTMATGYGKRAPMPGKISYGTGWTGRAPRKASLQPLTRLCKGKNF